ncbi:hypothetical protein JTB14_035038 [Gonioctena quinquepunctata]|nr:hypothetical protein JTB14_035038 [Gonioctena quinquepunctata]
MLLDEILQKYGIRRGSAEPCLYMKEKEGNKIYILTYVDDVPIACKEQKYIEEIYEQLKNVFQIHCLGNIKYFLGKQVRRQENGIFNICKLTYKNKIFKTFDMTDAKVSNIPLDTGYFKIKEEISLEISEKYRKAIGALLYIAVNTRPDISVSTSILSRKVSQPTERDWAEVKRILRYL